MKEDGEEEEDESWKRNPCRRLRLRNDATFEPGGRFIKTNHLQRPLREKTRRKRRKRSKRRREGRGGRGAREDEKGGVAEKEENEDGKGKGGEGGKDDDDDGAHDGDGDDGDDDDDDDDGDGDGDGDGGDDDHNSGFLLAKYDFVHIYRFEMV